jgi:hypothetical protein
MFQHTNGTNFESPYPKIERPIQSSRTLLRTCMRSGLKVEPVLSRTKPAASPYTKAHGIRTGYACITANKAAIIPMLPLAPRDRRIGIAIGFCRCIHNRENLFVHVFSASRTGIFPLIQSLLPRSR